MRLLMMACLLFISTLTVAEELSRPELVTQCVNCHGEKGISPNPGWPPIAGLTPEAFASKLVGYRQQAIPDSVMSRAVHDLNDEQIEELARYYQLLD